MVKRKNMVYNAIKGIVMRGLLTHSLAYEGGDVMRGLLSTHPQPLQ